jgi:hypothetical protein
MSVMTLYPYLYQGVCWVFDDPQTGLKEEAFVLGASEMISALVEAKRIPNAQRGFAMSFCDEPFDDHDVQLTWITPDEAARAKGEPVGHLPGVGNWYAGLVAGKQMVAWLCPALYEYFTAAPPRIFVDARPLPAGVDPIWHVGRNAPEARRYMSVPFDALQ